MNTSIHLVLACAVASLAGCASSPQQENDPAFGSSVRQMIHAQIHDPQAAENPSDQAPAGIDGIRAEGVMKTYRADVDKPARAQETILMQVGN